MASILAGNQDGCLLNLDNAAVGALLHIWKDALDFLAGLNEFDLDGEMVGDFEDVGGVEAVRGAESGYAFEDRGTVDTVLEKEVEQAGVDGDAVVLGAIAEVDGDFDGFSCSQHACASLSGAKVQPGTDCATKD